MSHLLTGSEKARHVRSMFARIVPRYDLMNTLMTLGADRRWREMAADLARVPRGGVALDVAAGTGELTLALARRGPRLAVGVDFVEEMLAVAKTKADAARIDRPAHTTASATRPIDVVVEDPMSAGGLRRGAVTAPLQDADSMTPGGRPQGPPLRESARPDGMRNEGSAAEPCRGEVSSPSPMGATTVPLQSGDAGSPNAGGQPQGPPLRDEALPANAHDEDPTATRRGSDAANAYLQIETDDSARRSVPAVADTTAPGRGESPTRPYAEDEDEDPIPVRGPRRGEVTSPLQNGATAVVSFVVGDALSLPFPDDTFDCVTTGFFLRNVAGLPGGLAELTRVVKPGGRVVNLELTRPSIRPIALGFRLFFHEIVPLVGRALSGDLQAYTYLPNSLTAFPDADTLADLMRRSGLRSVGYRLLQLGTIAIHVGVK